MEIKVRYFSKGGSTKKVAEAIAQATGTTAENTNSPAGSPTDILFIGGGIYAGDIDKNLLAFIQGLSSDNIKKVVVFSTSAGKKTMYNQVKVLLENKGIALSENQFHCHGKFLLARRGHPTNEDLNNAKAFAQSILSE